MMWISLVRPFDFYLNLAHHTVESWCKQQPFGMTRIRNDTYSLFTYYSADSDYEVTLMTKTTVYYNGLIVWRPPCIYKSSCAIDVEYFPYDAQTCFLKMGSWTYSGFQVRPMVLLRFFGPLIQGILVFDPIFQKLYVLADLYLQFVWPFLTAQFYFMSINHTKQNFSYVTTLSLESGIDIALLE